MPGGSRSLTFPEVGIAAGWYEHWGGGDDGCRGPKGKVLLRRKPDISFGQLGSLRVVNGK